jgi:hypothetical protein
MFHVRALAVNDSWRRLTVLLSQKNMNSFPSGKYLTLSNGRRRGEVVKVQVQGCGREIVTRLAFGERALEKEKTKIRP